MSQKHSVLIIVPSRGRPRVLDEMLGSFLATKSPNTKMVVYLNDDDPKRAEYAPVKHPDVHVASGPARYIADVYNHYAKEIDADYYSNMNDDHFFVTPQWDERLVAVCEEKGRGWGIACAADKLTDWVKYPHPSGCVISGKMTKVLGWIAAPGTRHINIDAVQGRICKAIGCFFTAPEILIEHRHWVNGMRTFDDNYRWVYSEEEQNHGLHALQKYMHEQFAQDVEKIKAAMAAEAHA